MTTLRQTLLVVYDSQAIRETVAVLGGETDYDIHELDQPELLTETVDSIQPALVILCAMTKQTTAYDCCRKLKAMDSGAFFPVVIYALHVSQETLELAYEAGADEVIKVTLKLEELLCRVRSLLRVQQAFCATQERARSLARASAEAADMMLQLEEADRRIREQNNRIREQQTEIEKHLATIRKEMELASALQLSLLPTTYPKTDDLRLFDRYIPAAELCGDYYDYLAMPDGTFWVSIADVTGHGVAPALVSVQVRTLARSAMGAGKGPAEVLAEVNCYMESTFNRDFLMTMVCMKHDPRSHTITHAGAGHCPMIVQQSGGCREIFSQGMPLGITADTTYTEDVLPLAPGDRIVLYTDGITEAAHDGDQFGPERLVAMVAESQHLDGKDVLAAALDDARQHAGCTAFDDDITLILLERPQP